MRTPKMPKILTNFSYEWLSKFYQRKITVKSSAVTPAAIAAALSSSTGSAEKTRFNSEKINGASGLD